MVCVYWGMECGKVCDTSVCSIGSGVSMVHSVYTVCTISLYGVWCIVYM